MTIRNNKDFGEVVRRERLKRKFRQVDLAHVASVRQASLSELENGQTNARLDTVIKILASLDLDLSIIARKKAEFDPTEY